MSHISSPPLNDLDIWEFITCSKCHLPFSVEPSAPPQVPFWLTECGHVICNPHLNADQSCCVCGSQQIQMIPLQRELDPPMSNWFFSLPRAMDTISYSARFQQDMLASLIRFLREKIAQQRDVLLRVKHEREELKNLRTTVEELRAENEQLRLYAGLDGDGTMSNSNSGSKRRRIDAYNTSGRNLSSPRSTTTPLGPNRLTLPADHPPPVLGQRSSDATVMTPKDSSKPRRPSSSRLRQYTYDPSHQQHAQPVASEPQQGTSFQQQMRTMMPPPPSVTRERPNNVGLPPGAVPSRARGQLHPGDVVNQTQRPPPPGTPFRPADVHPVGPTASNRFTPRAPTSQGGASSRFHFQTPDPRRFAPAAPAPGGSRVHSRAGNPDSVMHGGQRTPFFSGARIG